jgi:hypothetical protein
MIRRTRLVASSLVNMVFLFKGMSKRAFVYTESILGTGVYHLEALSTVIISAMFVI